MIGNLAMSLGGSLLDAVSPAIGDMLGLGDSTTDVIEQQAAAFEKSIYPMIQKLMDESMNKGAYNAAGVQGAGNVAESYKRQSDRYTGAMGAQEASAVNDLKSAADAALSNLGTNTAISQKAFADQARTQTRAMKDLAANSGAGALYAVAEGLGSANAANENALMQSMSGNTAQALGLAGSLMGKAGELGMQSKQQQQDLFVNPYRRQQENMTGLASTGFAQGFGNVANVNKMKTDPLGGLSGMLMRQGQFQQDVSNYSKDWRDRESLNEGGQ